MAEDIRVVTFNFREDQEYSDMKNMAPVIEFYIPKKNVVIFNSKKENHISNGELELTNYYGQIGIPETVAINFLYSNNHAILRGIIGSPANINGTGNINLVIKKESNLELLIVSDEMIIIDKEFITASKDDMPAYNYTYGGRTFESIRDEYKRRAIESIKPPLIVDTGENIKADFSNSKMIMPRDIDICMREKIINIKKFNGITNIFYEVENYKKKSTNNLSVNELRDMTTIGSLRDALENALKKEDFEKAALIRDEIKRIEDSIC